MNSENEDAHKEEIFFVHDKFKIGFSLQLQLQMVPELYMII